MSGSTRAYSNDKVAMGIVAVVLVLVALGWYTLLFTFLGFLIVVAVLSSGT